MYGYAGSHRETICGFRHVRCQCGLSRRVKGPERVAILLLQVRRDAVLLVGIGVSLAHWGGTILSGICATLRRAPLAAGILDYSDFQL